MEKSIPGYYLSEAICGMGKRLRSLRVETPIKSWQAFTGAKNTQVIFCKNAGHVLRCNSSQNPSQCSLRKFRNGALSSVVQDFRNFYGECWDSLSENMKGLPIKNNHEWIPHLYQSFCDSQERHCSNNLQSINPKEFPSKKLQKKSCHRDNNRVENGISSITNISYLQLHESRRPAAELY